MERLFSDKLRKWKSDANRKPLLIRGARQVGKSYTITAFGKVNFDGTVHIVDFERHPDWRNIFELNLDPIRIIAELEVLLNAKITAGKDLLFFDEIQAAPRAIMALRYFYEEMPQLHIIAAGSLLEFALKDISFPVGRIQLMNMPPMNFYEFLLATGKKMLAEIIISKPERLSDVVHKTLLESIRQYMFIGGMPDSIKVWIQSQSMADVFQIQSDLVETYRQDFSKYAPYADKQSLNHVLATVAKSIGHQIKYTRLSEEFSGPASKKSFELLLLARVLHKIRAASPAALPLGAGASEKKFKALTVDIGLMRSLNELPSNVEYMKSNLLSMYSGAMSEQFAGQEFLSSGLDSLHYWSRDEKSSSAEVDYLLVKNGLICPVEIKSGPAGKLRSMHLLLQEFPHIEKGVVLSTGQFAELPEQKLSFLPLYYAYYLALNGV